MFLFLVQSTIFGMCFLPLGYLLLGYLLSGSILNHLMLSKYAENILMFLSAIMSRGVSVTHLCTKTTITSSVNVRQFSIINNNDMDWTSSDLIYVISWNLLWNAKCWTNWPFREHSRKMKKPKNFDTFLNRHFKSNGQSPSKFVIQLVEKNIYIWSNFINLIKKYKETWNWSKMD